MDAEKIKNGLKSGRIGSEVLVFDAVESTNALARHYLEQGAEEGLVLIADSQSGGRGRLGRSWVSLPGVGIYLSILLKPPIQPQQSPPLTLLAGLATVQAINEFTRKKAQLKWPNDILLNGKKSAGILCEYHTEKSGEPAVIMGIGINVNHSGEDFPEELQAFATSLKMEAGAAIDRLALIRALLENLNREYNTYLVDGHQRVIDEWMQHSDMFGKPVSITRGESVVCGTPVELDSKGRLVIRTEKGEEMVFDSGEVSLGSKLSGH